MASDNSELRDAAIASAGRLGINPSDLLTAVSYETGSKMSPSLYGGKGGQYLGLIQFSPENQKKYGVTPEQTTPQQMLAVESYLRDRGVKPGMGLLDVYSAINAGAPGLYNRSDAANGGAPGTVADKVASMALHRQRANAILGVDGADMPPSQPSAGSAPGSLAPGASSSPDAAAATPSPGSTLADTLGGLAKVLAPQQQAAAQPQAQQPQGPQYPTIQYAAPPGLEVARRLARAMGNVTLG